MSGLWKFFGERLQRRLLVFFLPIAVLPVILLGAWTATQFLQTSTEGIDAEERTLAEAQVVRINTYLGGVSEDINIVAALPTTLELANSLISSDIAGVAAYTGQLERAMLSLAEVRAKYYKVRFLDKDGDELVRIDYNRTTGEAIVAPANQLQNKADRSYYQQTISIPEGGLYISPLDLNREGDPPTVELVDGAYVPVIRYGKPIFATNPRTGQRERVGMVIVSVFADNIFDILRSTAGRDTTFLVNQEGYFLYHSDNPNYTFGFESDIVDVLPDRITGDAARINTLLPEIAAPLLQAGSEVQSLNTSVAGVPSFVHYTKIAPPDAPANYYWVIADVTDQAALLGQIQSGVLVGVVLLVLLAIGIAFVVNWLARQITQPLAHLSSSANQMASGQLGNVHVDHAVMERPDEIGTLGQAFNTMSTQLHDVLGSLEARVAARTNDLKTSADIAAAANQVRDLNDLLSMTVNLIRDRFNFYYTQVYLVDGERRYAVLKDGTGYVGRRLLGRSHKLALDGHSLVSKAILTEKPVLVQDTTSDPDFLPNELLPETRAELVVPLRARGKVIGVLDIQHNQPGVFDDEVMPLFTTLAEQLAVTFENVQLFEDTERRAREMATVAEVSLEANRTLDLKRLLKTVTKLTRDNFKLYHAHIYLLSNNQIDLELAAGAGEVGSEMVAQGYRIPVDHPTSIVAKAARTADGVIVNDVRADVNFLPNLLLPETRSELAVPMIVAGEVLGVLDVQADVINRFDEQDKRVQLTLAAQIAGAVRNAYAFEEVFRAQQTASELAARVSTIAKNFPNGAIVMYDHDYRFLLVDGTEVAALGMNKAEMEGKTVSEIFPPEYANAYIEAYKIALSGEELSTELSFRDQIYQTYNIPVRDETGKVIAGLNIAQNITEAKRIQEERDQQLTMATLLNAARTPDDVVSSVVALVQEQGASVVNLLDIAVNEANYPVEVTVIADWTADGSPSAAPIGARFQLKYLPLAQYWIASPDSIVYLENIDEDPLVDESARAIYAQLNTRAGLLMPLHTAGRWIGLLSINWGEVHHFSDAEKRFFYTTRQQLIAVVETLRSARLVEKRANELASVAQVSQAVAAELNADDLLWAVVDLTQINFQHYHVQIYLVDAAQEYLELAAGADETGRTMVAEGHRIPLEREDSVVATAARSRDVQMVSDVTSAVNFLPNKHLPDTRSEMAVPIMYAGELFGVLDIQENVPGAFSDADAQVKRTLANQIAVALQNARQFQVTQMRLREVQANNRINEYIREDVDKLETLVENILKVVQEALNADMVVLSDFDEFQVQWLGFAAYGGGVTTEVAKTFVDPGSRYPHGLEALKNQDLVMVEDVEHYPGFPMDYIKSFGLKSVLVLPVIARNRLPSVIFVSWTATSKRLTDDEHSLASNLAAQITLGMERFLNQEAVTKAQQETERIFNSSLDLIGSANFEGYFTRLNPAWQVTLGWSQQELLAAPFISFVHPEDVELTNSEAAKLATGAKAIAFENRYRCKDGSFKWISWRTNSDVENALLHFVARDVTDAKAAEEARRLAREEAERRANQLQSVAQVSAATAAQLDFNELLWTVANLTKERFDRYHAHIYLLNEAGDTLVLRAGAGTIGRKMVERGHKIPLNREDSVVATVARTHEGQIVDEVTIVPNFLPNPLLPDTRSEMAVPILYGDELLGVLDVQDDTPNAFYEADLQVQQTLANQIAVALQNATAFERERNTVEQLKEVDRLKQEFLANMSHELRTPLNSIIGYSEVLKDGVDGELTDDAMEDVEAIYNSGKHLLNLINEILDLAKIEAGQMQLNLKQVDLTGIIRDVVHESQILVKDKSVEMVLVEESSLSLVWGDALRLRQIMLNLLSNAIKFTEQGSITIAYGMHSPTQAMVRVKDTGGGISEESQQLIFERFRQADGSSTRRAGGTGLGLAITRQLLQMHGGDIYVESEPGAGSTFWFTIPVMAAATSDTAAEPELDRSPAQD